MKTTASYMRIFCCLAVLLFVASVSTEMFAASAKAEAPKAAAIAKSGVIKTEAMPAIRVTKPVDDSEAFGDLRAHAEGAAPRDQTGKGRSEYAGAAFDPDAEVEPGAGARSAQGD
jgi:hypothetical protein